MRPTYDELVTALGETVGLIMAVTDKIGPLAMKISITDKGGNEHAVLRSIDSEKLLPGWKDLLMRARTEQDEKPGLFKVTDRSGNSDYLKKSGERWVCVGSNGTPLAFWYALGEVSEPEVKHRLDKCKTNKERLLYLQTLLRGTGRSVELVQ